MYDLGSKIKDYFVCVHCKNIGEYRLHALRTGSACMPKNTNFQPIYSDTSATVFQK